MDDLLEENSSQSLQELSKYLEVYLSTVGKKFEALEMIRKEGNSVSYEFTAWQILTPCGETST